MRYEYELKNLLLEHRAFEGWIIKNLHIEEMELSSKGVISFQNRKGYIIKNAEFARSIHKEFNNIKLKEERFKRISEKIIERAIRTTAGLLLHFYNTEIKKSFL